MIERPDPVDFIIPGDLHAPFDLEAYEQAVIKWLTQTP